MREVEKLYAVLSPKFVLDHFFEIEFVRLERARASCKDVTEVVTLGIALGSFPEVKYSSETRRV
jgi:hypothetical protein